MRKAPIEPLHDYFVSYEDKNGRYTEVNFETKKDAEKYIRRLRRIGIESELYTRVFPKV